MKNKLINIFILIISIIYGALITYNQKFLSTSIIISAITIIGTLILLIAYQKYIKYEVSFKLKKDCKFMAIASVGIIIVNVLLKTSPLIIIFQILDMIIFHLAVYKLLKNEKYIATTLLTLISIFFIKDIINLLYIFVTFSCIFLVEMLDKTAPYRKKNMVFITLSEIVLTYLFLTNYNFLLFYLLYLIYLIKKISIKPSIKASSFGIVISFIMVILSIFIKPVFITSNNYEFNTIYLLLQIILTIVISINGLIFKDEKIETAEKIILMIVLSLIILTNNYIQYSTIYSILLVIIIARELEKIPRFINCSVKLIDKNSLNNKKDNVKKVSAVIPNYNYEKYIEERIDSVLFQTYPISELIILDDVSTDNSVKIIENKLKEIKKKYPNLETKFIPNKKNSGNVFKQWKKCFEVSNNEYLWICEADDSASPYFLENIMKQFEKDEEIILSHSESLTMDENNKILMNNLREWIDIYKTDKWTKSFIEDGSRFNKENLIINNTIANVSGVVFKKKKNVPYEKYLEKAEQYKLAGDWYFYENVLEHGKIAYCKKSLNYHRMHSSSVTLTTKREKEYEEMCSIQNDISSRHKIDEITQKRIDKRREKFKEDFGFCEEELRLSNMDLSKIIKDKKEKSKILLSIIIPVYNTEPFLEKCLNSILENIPEKTEIIIINDGTPDNSEKIIKKFEKEYKDIIRYYKKTNGGLSDTKNYGIEHARGKYIGFVDSDDYIKPNMFSCMLKKAILDDADMVYCDVELVYEDGSHRYVKSTNYDIDDKLMQHLDTSLMPASWSKIVKRELFEGLTYPKGYNNEDVAVSPILFARSKKISKIDTPFYKYFQRTGSIQNSGFSEKRFVVFYTANLCFDRAKEFDKKTQEKIKGCIYTHQLFGLLFYLIVNEKNREKRLAFIEKFAEEILKFEDFDKNKYLVNYVKEHNRMKVFKYIKNKEIKRLDFYLRIGI